MGLPEWSRDRKCGGPRFAKINGTYNTHRTLPRTNGRSKQLYGLREEASATRNENTRAATRYFAASAKMIARNIKRLSPDDEGVAGRGSPAKKNPAKIKAAARCYEITSSMKNRIIEYRVWYSLRFTRCDGGYARRESRDVSTIEKWIETIRSSPAAATSRKKRRRITSVFLR